MAKIVLEFDFEEIKDEFDDFTYLDLASVTKKVENMSDEDAQDIAETWAQSDFYRVGINNAIIELIAHPSKTTMTENEISKMC